MTMSYKSWKCDTTSITSSRSKYENSFFKVGADLTKTWKLYRSRRFTEKISKKRYAVLTRDCFTIEMQSFSLIVNSIPEIR